MRLIDADDLITEILTHDLIGDDKEVDKIILDAPTVKAIPIEWIKKYIAEEGIYPNRELLSVEQADAIERMLENWEKENEQKGKSLIVVARMGRRMWLWI